MKEVTNFDEEVLNAKGPVLVDFWAPWCAPCRSLMPILEEIEETLQGSMTFIKVNADENPELAQKYGIRGLPTLIAFKDGEALQVFVGSQIKDQLLESLKVIALKPVSENELPEFFD